MRLLKLAGNYGPVYVCDCCISAIATTDGNFAPANGSLVHLDNGGGVCVKETPEEVISLLRKGAGGPEITIAGQ